MSISRYFAKTKFHIHIKGLHGRGDGLKPVHGRLARQIRNDFSNGLRWADQREVVFLMGRAGKREMNFQTDWDKKKKEREREKTNNIADRSGRAKQRRSFQSYR